MEAVMNIVLWLGDLLGSGFVRNVLLFMLFIELGSRPFYKRPTDLASLFLARVDSVIEKLDLIASRSEKAR